MRRAAALVLAVGTLAGCRSVHEPEPAQAKPKAPREAVVEAAPAPEEPPVLALLEEHVRRWAFSDPRNTWALCHGLLALGKDARLPDGRSVVDAILASASLREEGGRTFPVFEGEAPDGTPIEPHHNLVLRSLLAAGVSFDRDFEVKGRRFTVRDLYEGALFSFDPPNPAHVGREAWTLLAISDALARGESGARFETHAGRTVDAGDLGAEALADLDRETRFLDPVREKGLPLVKVRQGIFGEPCGGMHLVEAALAWTPESRRSELARILVRLRFRVHAEDALYARTREHAGPGLRMRVDAQALKLHGHWLEVLAELRDAGITVPTAEVDEAEGRLDDAFYRLQADGAFSHMKELHAQAHQLWLDLVGDAAHAVRALRAWKQG